MGGSSWDGSCQLAHSLDGLAAANAAATELADAARHCVCVGCVGSV